MYVKYVKRILDFMLSLVALTILFPFLLIIAVIIKIDSPGPVFFKQKRIGINKKHFNMLKFRTMRTDAPSDVPTHLLSNPEKYISRIGRILRKTSGDELPQLINTLNGSMSLIGPRPALWNQYDLVEERDKYGANAVRPGVTGWAQINGRDELPIEIKAKYDGEYIKKVSFLFDCKCLFGTILAVVRSDGVVEGGTGRIAKEKITRPAGEPGKKKTVKK